MKRAITILLVIAITAAITYILTIKSITIETDGDGDSAFFKALGIEWFVGINGYETIEGVTCPLR